MEEVSALQNFTFDQSSIRRLEVFHVLRCMAGPAIESLLLLDRYIWLREGLDHDNISSSRPDTGKDLFRKNGLELEVKLLNIFDQKADSGRNVALVITPKHSYA